MAERGGPSNRPMVFSRGGSQPVSREASAKAAEAARAAAHSLCLADGLLGKAMSRAGGARAVGPSQTHPHPKSVPHQVR